MADRQYIKQRAAKLVAKQRLLDAKKAGAAQAHPPASQRRSFHQRAIATRMSGLATYLHCSLQLRYAVVAWTSRARAVDTHLVLDVASDSEVKNDPWGCTEGGRQIMLYAWCVILHCFYQGSHQMLLVPYNIAARCRQHGLLHVHTGCRPMQAAAMPVRSLCAAAMPNAQLKS